MERRTGSASAVFVRGMVLLAAFALAACSSSGKMTRAAVNGDIVTAKRLLARGQDVNQVDKWGWTPLHWAAYYDQVPMIAYLLDSGADPNLVTTQWYGSVPPGSSALMIAAYYGHENLVDMLLKSGADKSLANDQGYTALRYAEAYDFAPCVKLLR